MTTNALNNTATVFDVDNLRLDGNTLSTTDTNGALNLEPDGTGQISSTKTLVGNNVGMLLSNADNTNTASSASLEIATGGTSGGDPYLTVGIDSTRAYAWGIDNTASDVLVETTGAATSTDPSSGTILRQMTSSGEQTMPLQPAFAAFLGTNDNDVTGNATSYTLGSGNALTEIFDQGGDFVTTGTFTAPVTGRYVLSAGFLIQQASTGTDCDFRISTSNRGWRGWQLDPSSVNVSGSLGFNMTVLADMDAGDTAVTGITVSGVGADTVDVFGGPTSPRTWFSGYLEC